MSLTPELKLQIAQMKMKDLKGQIWMLRELLKKAEHETAIYQMIEDFLCETLREMQGWRMEIKELTEAVAEGDPE